MNKENIKTIALAMFMAGKNNWRDSDFDRLFEEEYNNDRKKEVCDCVDCEEARDFLNSHKELMEE